MVLKSAPTFLQFALHILTFSFFVVLSNLQNWKVVHVNQFRSPNAECSCTILNWSPTYPLWIYFISNFAFLSYELWFLRLRIYVSVRANFDFLKCEMAFCRGANFNFLTGEILLSRRENQLIVVRISINVHANSIWDWLYHWPVSHFDAQCPTCGVFLSQIRLA